MERNKHTNLISNKCKISFQEDKEEWIIIDQWPADDGNDGNHNEEWITIDEWRADDRDHDNDQ